MRASFEAQRELHDRLRGARSRALRAANVATAKRVLEIGCGHAFSAPEWLERTRADVTLLDVDPPDEAYAAAERSPERVHLLKADARNLPFDAGAFDLVFAQCVLTWLHLPDRAQAIREATRTLAPGGHLVAIEPDYRSLAVDPDPHDFYETAARLLTRAGADIAAGRTLPRLFMEAGLETQALLFDRAESGSRNAAGLLFDLTLDDDERQLLATIEAWIVEKRPTVHLPFWTAIGRKDP